MKNLLPAAYIDHNILKSVSLWCTYNVQLEIVSKPMGALHADQNGLLLLSAEAHG